MSFTCMKRLGLATIDKQTILFSYSRHSSVINYRIYLRCVHFIVVLLCLWPEVEITQMRSIRKRFVRFCRTFFPLCPWVVSAQSGNLIYRFRDLEWVEKCFTIATLQRKIRYMPSQNTVVHVLVTSEFDYCNLILSVCLMDYCSRLPAAMDLSDSKYYSCFIFVLLLKLMKLKCHLENPITNCYNLQSVLLE